VREAADLEVRGVGDVERFLERLAERLASHRQTGTGNQG
jgi:hypothetical protein